jgi:hypothetical protein
MVKAFQPKNILIRNLTIIYYLYKDQKVKLLEEILDNAALDIFINMILEI